MNIAIETAIQHGIGFNGTPSQRYAAFCRIMENTEECCAAFGAIITDSEVEEAHDRAARQIAGVL